MVKHKKRKYEVSNFMRRNAEKVLFYYITLMNQQMIAISD
jgi:hypothetical protein